MGIFPKRLAGRPRGPATGNSTIGAYRLVTTVVVASLTYSIVATISIVIPLLSTATIALLPVSV